MVPPEVLKKYSTLLDGLRDGALAEALRWNNFWVFPETEEQKRAIIEDRRRQAGAQQDGLPDHGVNIVSHTGGLTQREIHQRWGHFSDRMINDNWPEKIPGPKQREQPSDTCCATNLRREPVPKQKP